MSSERKTYDEDLMIRYLLGELAEAERVEFEESCFVDDQQFEQLLAIEAELTDDYVRNNLLGLRREQLETRLLNGPEGRYEVEFARLITDSPPHAPQAAPPVNDSGRYDWRRGFAWLHSRGPALHVAFASAVLLVLVGLGLWTYWSFRQSAIDPEQAAGKLGPGSVEPPGSRQTPEQSVLPRPSPGEHTAAATPAPPSQETPAEKRPPGQEAPAIVALLVVPGFDRGTGRANDLIISPQTQAVRLQLALENSNHRGYRAVLRTVEGKEIFNRRGLKAQATSSGRAVTLEVPARAFPEGDFILTLSGTTPQGEVEDVHKYFISVSRN